MNSPQTVCILTAGKGTRMGEYGNTLHKALLPLGKKAIISHIIDKFPRDTTFVIALGYRAEQVRAYLEAAHPDRLFAFEMVDNYDKPGSGPGYSLLCCKKHLTGSFFFVACDTVWTDTAPLPTEYDWFGVADVDAEQSGRYCNFKIDRDQTIVAIKDKEKVFGPEYAAFVGLCYVKSSDVFWSGLANPKLISGEHQVSNGTYALVANASAKALKVDWIDTGDKDKYEQAVKRFDAYDFSKPDEAIFINDRRVIKYFSDHDISAKRVQRARINPAVFPKVSDAHEGFYHYPFVDGKTLYEYCDQAIFGKFLTWLDVHLWKQIEVEKDLYTSACEKFYKKKSLERINKYLQKYPDAYRLSQVNGVKLRPIQELIDAIPWDVLCRGVPTFFHGDLQFDNIVYDKTSDTFTLLDWRQDFAGNVNFGDQYYDLAKLRGGTILNYDYIKAGLFQYSEEGGVVTVDTAQRLQAKGYETQLRDFIASKGLSYRKVELLVPVIYLNMAPLHHAPFDKFLFALGCLMLQQALDANARQVEVLKDGAATGVVHRHTPDSVEQVIRS